MHFEATAPALEPLARTSHTPVEGVYPFSAIVGQDRLKRALVLCAVNPQICGALIRGEKGTGKSTAVRSLAALLPAIDVNQGCPYACDPRLPSEMCERCRNDHARGVESRRVGVFTLPLNATEDRISGGIDFRQALTGGARVFEPGLLASVHRGILYIDEVNLLEDHLVDIILDAAAAGVNRVEREGLSIRHPSRFVLVGTMNPEEGALRPQLLDRFGLCVEVEGEKDLAARIELMRRREAFDMNNAAFLKEWRLKDQCLTTAIGQAQSMLKAVEITTEQRAQMSRICREACVAGHRADLMMERCARTIAAVEGRTKVLTSDIQEAATFVLPHRIRQNEPPPSAPPPPMKEPKDDGSVSENNEPAGGETTSNSTSAENDFSDNGQTSPEASNFLEERIFAIGQTFNVRRIEVRKDRLARRGSGRRSHTRSANKSGRYVKNRMAEDFEDIALDATLRAAAPYQSQRSRSNLAIEIHRADVRKKIRQRRISNFIVFAVDASGSMGAKKRMVSTKGAIMSLLLDAYRMRDRIALVAFRKSDAEILLPPTNSVSVASRLLQTLPTGGRTPLSAGLVKAFELARTRLYKDPFLRPILIFITDGRGNVPLNHDTKPASEALSIAVKMAMENRINYIVVDTEGGGFMKFGLAGSLARNLKAKHYSIENLRANDLVRMVKEYKHA